MPSTTSLAGRRVSSGHDSGHFSCLQQELDPKTSLLTISTFRLVLPSSVIYVVAFKPCWISSISSDVPAVLSETLASFGTDGLPWLSW